MNDSTPATMDVQMMPDDLEREAMALQVRLERLERDRRDIEREERDTRERLATVLEMLAENQAEPLAVCASAPSPVTTLEQLAREAAEVLGKSNPFPHQVDAAVAVCTGRDTFLLSPAGSGKTLAVELVALLLCLATAISCDQPVVLIVSPLLALCREQCARFNVDFAGAVHLDNGETRDLAVVLDGTNEEAFHERWTPPPDLAARRVATLSGDDDDPLREMIRPGQLADLWHHLQTELEEGQPKRPLVIFLSPEKIMLSLQVLAFVRNVADANLLKVIAVDEAHCIGEHGFDFRPSYLLLGLLRTLLPAFVWLIVTATAPPSTVASICSLLHIDDQSMYERRFPTGSLRRQMSYELLGSSGLQQRRMAMYALLEQNLASGCAIVYCGTQRTCEREACNYVNWRFGGSHSFGVDADGGLRPLLRVPIGAIGKFCHVAFFHAGLNSRAKESVEQASASGLVIIFATIAWGMGMDKSDVRLVIHWALPRSISAYYQEVSRAARDELLGKAVLFWSLQAWVVAAQQRSRIAGSSSAGLDTEQDEYSLTKMLLLLKFLLDSHVCRHEAFETALGDGSAIDRCSCTAATIDPVCMACAARVRPSPSASPPSVITAREWLPALQQCVRELRRTRGESGDPTLLQIMHAWRRCKWRCSARAPAWISDLLLAHAIAANVFALLPRNVNHSSHDSFTSRHVLTARLSGIDSLAVGPITLDETTFDSSLRTAQLATQALELEHKLWQASEAEGVANGVEGDRGDWQALMQALSFEDELPVPDTSDDVSCYDGENLEWEWKDHEDQAEAEWLRAVMEAEDAREQGIIEADLAHAEAEMAAKLANDAEGEADIGSCAQLDDDDELAM